MILLQVGRERVSMAAGALVLIAWGGAGLVQGLNTGFSGGLYDPGYRVPEVRRGGLADRSGFRSGDRVISAQGRPVEELGMESRWPRSLVPRAGESRRFVVERHGERIALDVVFPGPFPAAVNNRIRAAVIGLAWLVFGLLGFLTTDTRPARTLAHIGLAAWAGAALDLGPHMGSWNGVQGHLGTAAGVLMLILLLRFFVTFPAPKRVSESRIAFWLVYGAWICLLVFLLVELIVHPALYYATGSVSGPLIVAYAVLIFAAIVHTFVKTPRKELRQSGMVWIVCGLVIGMVLPFVLPAGLPGWTNALPVAAIPLSMAIAVRKRAEIQRLLGGWPGIDTI